MVMRIFFSMLILIAGTVDGGAGEVDVAPLKRWVEEQESIESLSCSFTQEKKLRTLQKPLVASGRLYFRAPEEFRWELGEPARTIMVHRGETVTMIDVKNKRAQVLRLDAEGGGGGGAASGFIDLGFPRSWEAFEKAFGVRSLTSEGGWMTAELLPRNPALAKGVSTVTFVIAEATQKLHRLALDLRDRSTITTTFDAVVRNGELPAGIFETDLEGYAVRGEP